MADPVADVIVAGAGPAGLTVARGISGKRVLVLNASPSPGWPPHCTGLVSTWTARILGPEAVTETYTEAVFVDDELRERCVIRGRPIAVRLSRPLLEEHLAEEVIASGHVIRNNALVDSVRGKCVHVHGRGWMCASDSVVLATGYSRFSSLFGAERCNTLPGFEIRARLRRRVDEDRFITIHGRRFAPDFFAWIVPLNSGREVLVGLAASSYVVERLGELIRYLSRRGMLDISTIISHRAGKIMRGPPAHRVTIGGQVYGIGDVLCASKPFTGGGLYGIAVLGPEMAKSIDEGSQTRLLRLWKNLREELLAQRMLTRISILMRDAWWLALSMVCLMQDECSIDYDRHSSLIECLLGGRRGDG